MARFESYDEQREGTRTGGFETVECLEPGVEAPFVLEYVRERLVRRNMLWIAREHPLECRDRPVRTAALAEDDTDVEIGSVELRIERQRPLVRTQRKLPVA